MKRAKLTISGRAIEVMAFATTCTPRATAKTGNATILGPIATA